MYTNPNFERKCHLKHAIASGKRVVVFQPGPFAKDSESYTGDFSVEGPHFPKSHSWYARARVEKGVVMKILS